MQVAFLSSNICCSPPEKVGVIPCLIYSQKKNMAKNKGLSENMSPGACYNPVVHMSEADVCSEADAVRHRQTDVTKTR